MPEKLHIFTSAAVNYLPKVRVLFESVRKYHPEACLHLVLADVKPDWLDCSGEPFDFVHSVSELDIPNWRGWCFSHTIVELSTAIKPFALSRLLADPDCGSVLYFDPDMVLFSRVDDILAMLENANLVLTPHQNKPEQTLDAIRDNEMASMKHGIFNLGFIGVRNTVEGHRFAKWWSDRTYHFCRAEVENGLFTDQKWVDFAPVFFDGVTIVKSSRHNVATWNLTTRRLSGDLQHGFLVDGEPLGFYHFTGFDSGAHRIMMEKNAGESPSVRALVRWYEDTTSVHRDDPVSKWPWAFGTYSDGTPIEPCHRWLYRDHADLQAAFPDPFDVSGPGMNFLNWCNTEGRLRFPQCFSGSADYRKSAAADGTDMPAGAVLRLFFQMFRPVRGKALRVRVAQYVGQHGFGALVARAVNSFRK